jgi:hypothetical protein
MTQPKSKSEAVARSGYESRHVYRQGPGAAKAARNLTRRQIGKAIRKHNKWLVEESLITQSESRRTNERQTS